MTPEQQLAQALGELPTTEQEKLSSAFRNMSIDQLTELLSKEAGVFGKPLAIRVAEKTMKKKSEMEKLSAAEKIAMADNWGRALARAHFENMTKIALNLPGGLSSIASKAMGAGKQLLSHPGVTKAVGQSAKALTGPIARNVGIGAAGGAALGALKKPEAGGSRVGGALRGAAMGAGVAGGASLGAKKLMQSGGAAGSYLRGAAMGT